MLKKFLLGVDLGTSSTKAALYTLDGQLLAESYVEVSIYYPKPGVVEQENEDFYTSAAKAVSTCIQESGIDPKSIAAIAFDSQMAGIGTVDEAFKPVTRFDSWLDMRCQPYIEFMEKLGGESITRLTGCPPTCAHGPKILWWKEERPQDYQRVMKFVTPAGYVGGRMVSLKGEDAFIDPTFLHFSGFSDAKNGTWSEELCNLFGLDSAKLPRIVDPWHVVGEVTAESAKAFGLASGTLVAAGCGDTAASALGAGIVRPGMVFDVAGTAAVLAGCTDRFVADLKNRTLITMRSVIPGLWNPLAYIAGGGLALRWFRDQFYNLSRGKALDWQEDLYDTMLAKAAEAPPGSAGLFFAPHLGGRVCPSVPEMRGAWIGFSWNHSLSHFARSVLESVAYEYAFYLEILKELIPDLNLVEARVVGGGARNAVWNQIKADVLGILYQPLKGNEFGSWGCAMIAGKAAGLFEDLAALAQSHAIANGDPFNPDGKNHKEYRTIIQQYIRWQDILSQSFR